MLFATADLCDEHKENVRVLNKQLHSYGGKESFYGSIVTIKLDEDNRGLVAMLRDEEGKGRVAVVDVEEKFCAVVGDNLINLHKPHPSNILKVYLIKQIQEKLKEVCNG